ncbi:MAG TPA: dihydrolipoamide acetyltransferase family protein, partial [Magnetospirillaceae bacterium]|nr:dihydrolipoamide acetyltransferase family protein [Magnetospirillaceae bacterium]
MAVQVLMPQLGLTMTEGLLTEWSINEGDRVRKGDILFSVENDKAVLPVEAQADGILAAVSAQAGETVPVGAVLALILAEGESLPAAEVRPQALADAVTAAAESPADRPREDFVPASPRARILAARAGLDLGSVAGTGPDGAVLERDLSESVPAAPREERGTAVFQASASAPGDSEVITLSRVGRIGAERMAKSWTEIPQFTLYAETCASALLRMRARGKDDGKPFTITVLLAGLLARALRDYPKLNASWEGNGQIRVWRTVNVGVAMDGPDGLVVPVIMDCASKGFAELARELAALSEKANSRALTAGDLSGGTVTLSNLGMFGVKRFQAIVNPPQTAIIAAGAVERRPVETEDGEIRFLPHLE